MKPPFWLAALRSTYLYMHGRERLRIPVYHNKKWAGQKILSRKAGSDYIEEQLSTNRPFFITRLGAVECEIIRQTLLIRKHFMNSYSREIVQQASLNAGIFFKDEEYLDAFTDIYLESMPAITGIGIWFRPMEDYIIQTFARRPTVFDFYSLYPGINEWTSALAGKKVLVVHPFTKSIERQYARRQKIFPQKPELLPNFDLQLYKPVVSHAGSIVRFSTWDSALESMASDISCLDFDTCLIGCGAYGLPLGKRIYSMGKQVVHVGGSLQLLFGITGHLYSNYDLTKNLMNEDWVYPMPEETPPLAGRVENYIYWEKK